MIKNVLMLVTSFVLCAGLYAQNHYVTTNGSDNNNGQSWDNAFSNIQTAIAACSNGDTVFVAQGTYYITEALGVVNSDQKAVSLMGSYNAATGKRSVGLLSSVIDGSALTGSYFLVSYAIPSNQMCIDGFVIQNGQGKKEGGALYMRSNMVL